MSIKEMITGMPDQDIHKAAPIPDRLKREEKIMILTGDNAEDTEFFFPYYCFAEHGFEADVVTENGGAFKCKHGLGLKDSKSINDVRASDYALLYIPGGKAPASLRKNEKVIAFVKEFAHSGKPVAAVCHGPQILITADLVKGVEMACWPGVADELKKAGGIFADEALVEDGQFITARQPGDLHRHVNGALKFLNGDTHENHHRMVRGEDEDRKAPYNA